MARIGGSGSTDRRKLYGYGSAAAAVVIGAGVIFSDGFEKPAEPGAPPPPVVVVAPPADGCPLPPASFGAITKDWSQLFALPTESKKPRYALGQSYPTPIPFVGRSQYTVTPFVPPANHFVNLYFDQAQARAGVYGKARPADAMFLTISPCPGDFRPPDWSSADRFLTPSCRIFENSGSLVWSTSAIFGGCVLEPGKTYYLNVIAANPEGGIEPGESSCAATAPDGCDVNAVTQSK